MYQQNSKKALLGPPLAMLVQSCTDEYIIQFIISNLAKSGINYLTLRLELTIIEFSQTHGLKLVHGLKEVQNQHILSWHACII